MNRFLLRRVLGVLFLLGLLYFTISLVWFCQASGEHVQYQELPVQETIFHESRFRVQAFYLAAEGPYLFWVSIESFEHTEVLAMDVRGSVLLLDDLGQEYLPDRWQVSEQEEFKLVGKLGFDSVSVSANRLELVFFVGVEELRFFWDVPGKVKVEVEDEV